MTINNIGIDFKSEEFISLLNSINDSDMRNFIDKEFRKLDGTSYKDFTKHCYSGVYHPTYGVNDEYYFYKVFFHYKGKTVNISVLLHKETSELVPCEII